MADFSLSLDGLAELEAALDELEGDLESSREVIVGTGVSYSIYLESGTRHMDPKPFFGPAINEVRTQGVERFVEDNTNLSVEALDTLDQLVAVLGLALERRIKEIITQKGLIDTGTLRASVVAVPGTDPSALPTESDLSGFTADSPAPPTAGRAVTETVEVDL